MEDRVKELIERLRGLKDSGDIESDHIEADDILCDIIAEYGHPEVKEIFDEMPKWYA